MMKRTAFGLVLASCVCWLGIVQAHATVVTLQMNNTGGVTNTNVADTQISTNSTFEAAYNWGGAPTLEVFKGVRVALYQFDLSPILSGGNVASVNSATLKLYRTKTQFGDSAWAVKQLAEGWVAGTGNGQAGGNCDGAQWFARNGGNTVAGSALVSDGNGLYYVDGISGLAADPKNSNNQFVRLAGNNVNNDKNTYITYCDSLATLQAAGTTTPAYYWDEAAGRLYVNKNSVSIRYYTPSDMWTTPGGTTVGDAVTTSVPATAPGWMSLDATNVVNNWLVGGQDNYGFRISMTGNGDNFLVSSDYVDDPTLRPELVLDVTYTPEPATLALLMLGGVAVLRRRR